MATGPDPALVALGYAGWGRGQLEAELSSNTWLTVPANPAIIFETPFEHRWTAALGLPGVDIRHITHYAGQCLKPADGDVARLDERDRNRHIVVAFDFGLRRIGVATANRETRTASPLTTVRVDRELPWRELDRILDDWRPAQLVVGVPEGDGAASIARRARAFAAALGERYGLPPLPPSTRRRLPLRRSRSSRKSAGPGIFAAASARAASTAWRRA